MGAGVPRPVQPKFQMQRSMTPKPTIAGITPSQRQRASPVAPPWKPSHGGRSQNQSARNPAPTMSDASAPSQLPLESRCGAAACFAMMVVSERSMLRRQNSRKQLMFRRKQVFLPMDATPAPQVRLPNAVDKGLPKLL